MCSIKLLQKDKFLIIAFTILNELSLRPLQVGNIFTFIRQGGTYVPACWLFKTSSTS